MLKRGEQKRRVDFFDRLNRRYGESLAWVLEHRGLTLASVAVTAALTFLVLFLMPKGFFPEQDTGLIEGISQAAPTISFGYMVEKQQQLVASILKDPAVASLSSFVGIDQTSPTINQGAVLINLKDKSERDRSADVI